MHLLISPEKGSGSGIYDSRGGCGAEAGSGVMFAAAGADEDSPEGRDEISVVNLVTCCSRD